MSNSIFKTPTPVNEVVRSYAPGSADRKDLQAEIAQLKSKTHDIPMFIGGKEVRTGEKVEMRPPHETKHLLGHYHKGGAEHINMALLPCLVNPKMLIRQRLIAHVS